MLTPEAIREVMDTTWTEYLWPIISESDKTDVLVFEQKTAVHDVLFPSLPTALVTLRKLAIGAKVENDVIKRRWDKLLFAVLALIREMAETTYSVHLATCSARTVLVMEWGYLSGPDHFDRVVGQLLDTVNAVAESYYERIKNSLAPLPENYQYITHWEKIPGAWPGGNIPPGGGPPLPLRKVLGVIPVKWCYVCC